MTENDYNLRAVRVKRLRKEVGCLRVLKLAFNGRTEEELQSGTLRLEPAAPKTSVDLHVHTSYLYVLRLSLHACRTWPF